MSAPTTSTELAQITQELYKKNLDLVYANKQLALLQKLYEIMMDTYNLEDVAQEFIEVIVQDLGFASGLVALKNPLNSHLQGVALVRTEANLKALKLINHPLQTLSVSLHNEHNLLVRAFHSKKKQLTHHLKDILYPAISLSLVEQIREITQIQSTRVYPLYFGRKTLGVFTLSADKKDKTLTSQEEEIMERVQVVFGVAVDRVMLYQDLRYANKKLKILDKRKDEFLNVAAHELRAPLTAVKGYLSMVSEGDAGSVPPKVSEFLTSALEGAEREIRLVNNLLNVSRIEEGRLVFQLGKVSLTKVVRTVFDEFKLDAEHKGLQFELRIPESLKDLVNVDEDRIHEVVANFISNAIKYTDKGSVTVQLYAPPMPSINKDGVGGVGFAITDTGYGMTPEEREKLFGKFYRAESSAGKTMGTGLGLYITKLLIEKFGGQLGVQTERGKGSTFWFELPVVEK